jgi:hypothetical protein
MIKMEKNFKKIVIGENYQQHRNTLNIKNFYRRKL